VNLRKVVAGAQYASSRRTLLPGSQAATLEAGMNAFGDRFPQLGIGLYQRPDFPVRQFEPLLTECDERLPRLPHKPETQFFVREQLTDEQLDRFLRHDVWLPSSHKGNARTR
jgi:hypothetical protein